MTKAKVATPVMLNGTVTLGSDDERALLMSFVSKIRAQRIEGNRQRFALLRLCKEFEDSEVWKLYGTWPFARVLQEECGVKYADYEVYRTALECTDAGGAETIGMRALREIRRVLRGVADVDRADTTATLVSTIQRKIDAYRAEHGFAATGKAATTIVRIEAQRMGIAATSAKVDGLRARYAWLVSTMRQIESLSDDTTAVGVLARNALMKVSGETVRDRTA